MKMSIPFSLLVLAFSLNAFAVPASKICFYAGGDLGQKGDRFVALIASTKLKVTNLKGEGAWEGTFTRQPNAQVKGKDGKVYLNGTSQVVKTDLATSNGVIHVIDSVILPPEKK